MLFVKLVVCVITMHICDVVQQIKMALFYETVEVGWIFVIIGWVYLNHFTIAYQIL